MPPEPLYVTSLEEIFWAGILVAITMAMHGVGMLLILRVNAVLKQRLERASSFVAGMCTLVVTSWLILLVHLLEVFSWASFFYWKNAVAVPQLNFSTSYYFALMDYTTLGSNYSLVVNWRLLSGMIAMAGLLTFAWSTGVLLTLAQDFQDQQLQLLKLRRDKRSAPKL
ncbi:MAG: ion channel [Verrucomicrobiota bacterium]